MYNRSSVYGQSVMLYQQVLPLPNTHRFVRLFLTDAGRRVQSVRPAHQGYHQEAGMREAA